MSGKLDRKAILLFRLEMKGSTKEKLRMPALLAKKVPPLQSMFKTRVPT